MMVRLYVATRVIQLVVKYQLLTLAAVQCLDLDATQAFPNNVTVPVNVVIGITDFV